MRIQEYLSLVAMEECAEIQQALSKALRFGFDDHHPEKPDKTNEDEILTEYYQLVAMIEELQNQKILKKMTEEDIQAVKNRKIEKVYHYAEYSIQKGNLDSFK